MDGNSEYENENITVEVKEIEPVVEEAPLAQEEQPVVEEQSVVEEQPHEEPVEEQEQPVVEEQEQPVVEEQEQPVVEEQEQPVVEEQEQPVVEEQEQPVVEEQQQPVVEEQQQPVVEEQQQPVVEEQEQPIKTIPQFIFIVPYRDRKQQYEFFSKHMETIMEDYKNNYEIYYIHQTDSRDFNRGAMKNIGFLMVKEKYPENYKNITLIFNDVDIMPLTKNFLNYNTTQGVVKHLYGFTYALGGIVCIKASDFEQVNGFPNFWAWGYEDNLLQRRVLTNKLQIDRSQFYPILDKNILILPDGMNRVVNRKEFDRYLLLTTEGINSIHNLNYTIDENNFVNVSTFSTGVEPYTNQNVNHDLRSGPKPFGNVNQFTSRRGARMGMIL